MKNYYDVYKSLVVYREQNCYYARAEQLPAIVGSEPNRTEQNIYQKKMAQKKIMHHSGMMAVASRMEGIEQQQQQKYRYNSAIYNSKKDVRFVLVCSQRNQPGSRHACLPVCLLWYYDDICRGVRECSIAIASHRTKLKIHKNAS